MSEECTVLVEVYIVEPGQPRATWEAAADIEFFLNEEDAERMYGWWRYDQGREGTVKRMALIECPLDNHGKPILPAYVQAEEALLV